MTRQRLPKLPAQGIPVTLGHHQGPRMVLEDSGTRTEERMGKIEPGQRIAVRW